MTFKTWLKRTYFNANSKEGDLARAVWSDESFPKNGARKFDGWHQIIKGHLYRAGACYDCMETFEKCWKEYELCERKRLKMALPKQ